MIYIDKNESPVTPLDEKTMTSQRHIIYILMQHMNNSRKLMLSFTDYRLNKLLQEMDLMN
ncbi:histidinol-phosphate aminotransferase [Staphylococcus aureus]|nr:histidinol-phosphate aminotransferase [Staphylococcus aureus]